ncbi:hypothetical protein NFX46_23940 [Streptomyces phaeoluteigriseus]|uniref:MarR family transcriptional regulator n=1 Tax=Streptomyces phaeoluteigriseus TaxID=114686 RepID=A0ABY4ZDU0_9ACTN|nr:hypothetical protein [Streptomyces phaeoluteigriseus]USQ86487.1 hypothetical protein NFX46_23940 [Streptomyces phaeoluteigriseus]
MEEVKGHRGTAMPHLTPRGQDHWKRVDRAAHTAWPARDAGDGDDELLRTLLGPLAGTLDASARV